MSIGSKGCVAYKSRKAVKPANTTGIREGPDRAIFLLP
jgi:hypothetical protein